MWLSSSKGAGTARPINRWLREGAVLCAYGLLTVFATRPVAWRFFSGVPGFGQDDFQFLWNFWWVRKAFLEMGVNPLFTPMLFHPQGASLAFHTLSLYNTLLLGVPFRDLLGAAGTFNFAYLSAFALTAYGTYRLVLRVTGDRPAGLAAGLVLAFSPYHFAHVQHLNVTSVQFLPFYVLALLNLRDRPSPARGVLAGGVFVLLALSSWHYAVFALYFTLLFGIWFALGPGKQMRRGPQLRSLFVAAVTAAVLLSPLVVPMIRAAARGDFGKLSGGTRSASADLLAFFVPSPFHPWTRGWAALQSLYGTFSASWEEGTVFLGYSALFLGALGAARVWRRGAQFWAAAMVAFCLLALGPDLQVRGEERLGFTRLPYNWFVMKVPFLNAARSPARFVSVAVLCLSVLVGYGLRELTKGRGNAWRWTGAGLAGGVLLVEFWAAPLPLRDLTLSPVYREIVRDKGEFAVLEVPVRGYLEGAIYMFAQTVHGRPITGGTLSHIPPSAWRFVENDPFLRLLDKPERIPAPAPTVSTGGLAKAAIRYVVLHKDAPAWSRPDGERGAERLRAVEAFLDRNLRRLPGSTERVLLYGVESHSGRSPASR